MIWNDDSGRGNVLIASIVGFFVGKIIFGSIGLMVKIAKLSIRKFLGLFKQVFAM